MVDDLELVRGLLRRMEGDDLEFKRDQYRLESEKQKAELVKDIICIANTPRSGPGYVILGVATQDGRPTDVVGCVSHPDPAELGRIVAGPTQPVPTFSYRVVEYEGKTLGLLEVPPERNVPIMLRRDYGGLRKGAVYLRRNTECITGDQEDVHRIAHWAKQTQDGGLEATRVLPSWDTLYRECDAFGPRRNYVAVLDRTETLTDDDWAAFAAVGWDLVIDFDPDTDTTGAYSKAGPELAKRRSLRLTALDDAPVTVGAGSSIWVGASGLHSRPSTIQSRTWREWNQTKARPLTRWVSEAARATEPSPATAVIFGGERSYVQSVCDILDQTFGSRLAIVFAVHQQSIYSEIMEKVGAAGVSINLAEACAGLREIRRSLSVALDFELPKVDGGTVVVASERARWVEEELEIVHVGLGLSSADTGSELRDFLRGFPITWYGLNVRMDIDRLQVTSTLENHLSGELASRDTRRVSLFHWPGAGGSTLGRRVAWNLHWKYPTAIAKEINPHSTIDRLQYLFNLSRLPILVVVEAASALSNDMSRVYDEVRSANVPVVFLRIERRVTQTTPPVRHYLDAMLSTPEAVALAEKLVREVPDRRSALENLVNVHDRRQRTPFYFGLVAFEKDFMGLESYVKARLDRAEGPAISVCKILALVYHFAQRAVPVQLFASLLGLSPSKSVSAQHMFAPELQELFVELTDRTIRPVHELVAEEMVEQLLSLGLGERRNWKNALADTAIEFAHLCAQHHCQPEGAVPRLLHTVFIDRLTEETPAGPWEGAFSALISEIPTVEGRQRVFETLTSLFPQEPHFWAHLGRFYSRSIRDHSKSHEAHQRALRLAEADPVIRHMAAMSWRVELYDILNSASEGDFLPQTEERVQTVVKEAQEEFAEARRLDLRSDHNYISEIQMVERVVGVVAKLKRFGDDIPQFLAMRGNQWYRDLMDHAEALLSELSRARAGEVPSRFQQEARSRLDRLYGEHSKAIEGWTNLLARADVYRPPVRRMLIRAYLSRQAHDWSRLSKKELLRVSELASQNLSEEPDSDQNLRLWFQAIRYTEETTIELAAEQLGYRRLQLASVDTLYYLYILKFLQAEMGALEMATEVQELVKESSRVAAALPHRTKAFEWLGKGRGWQALLHVTALGDWDHTKEFWSHEHLLKRVEGRISRIVSPASGEIELPTGLKAFFVPSRGHVPGGYIRGQDVSREVAFYLGFSYDGLRAWSVGDIERGNPVQE